jgi:pyrroline-5-carboxylate reductase
MADKAKIGFIGGGKMAQAIASGFLLSGLVKPENVIASAVTEGTLGVWKVHTLDCYNCNLIFVLRH